MRMTRLLFFLLLFFPLTLQAAAEEPLLNDKPDQVNYSLGYDLGVQLFFSNVSFNPEVIWKALNEGLSDVEPQQTAADYKLGFQLGQKITRHDIEFRAAALWQGLYDMIDQVHPRVAGDVMSQLLAEIKSIPEDEVPVKANTAPAPAPPPKIFRLPGQKFLAENSDKKNIISLSSGLQYRIIKSGTGKAPMSTDSVVVNYEGTTTEGNPFSGFGIQTETFAVNKLMPGLSQALQLMREGDHWEIFIPSRLAFKDVGPMAGQTVIYDLELVEVLPQVQ